MWLARHEKKWLALLAWLGAQTALLSVYSVGQFSASGGTRFLIPSLVFAIGVAVALSKLPPRYRLWALAVGLLACRLTFPGREKTKQQWDGLNCAPQTEHEAVLRWAAICPLAQ